MVEYASSNVKICILISDRCVKHYVAKSVHVGTGKQETVKEAVPQVCNESMKIYLANTCTVEYK